MHIPKLLQQNQFAVKNAAEVANAAKKANKVLLPKKLLINLANKLQNKKLRTICCRNSARKVAGEDSAKHSCRGCSRAADDNSC